MGEGTNRALIVCLLGVVALAAGAGLGLGRRPVPSSPTLHQDPPAAVAATVSVHVAGWVMAPGVVSVPEGAIVAQAIDAAGGLLPGAAVERINLAAPVRGGDQIVVPGPDGDRAGSTSGAGAAGTSDGIISLNQATVEDLESLPGIGPVLAERIIAHREQIGGFQQVEDLLQVPGIGEAKLASLRDLVRP